MAIIRIIRNDSEDTNYMGLGKILIFDCIQINTFNWKQWNLSKADVYGAKKSVRFRQISLYE